MDSSSQSYIKSIPGGLKTGALVINVIVCICVLSSGAYYDYFSTTSRWALFVSLAGGKILILQRFVYLKSFDK